eukprot:TRINITY_DN64685_c0_g1_i1.p1 TRINITY_DN64685_c0_g1~~TRINITY_DN64685_c0_g1_i1.p1  ORF type:complete len:428 (+),score=51.14 TRINITY_DN64685_c0_g1_i1:52-1335(+)
MACLRVAILIAGAVSVAAIVNKGSVNRTRESLKLSDASLSDNGASVSIEVLNHPELFAGGDAADVTNSLLPLKATSHMRSLLRKPAQEQAQAQAMLLVYVVAIGFVIACVSAMYYPMGFAVILQIVLYICALAFVKISVKSVFVGHNFFYPKFVTALHLAVSSLAGFAVMLHRTLKHGEQFTVPTRQEMYGGILPIAITFAFSIGSENSALVFVSASFSEVIGACAPVFSALLTVLMGLPFRAQLLVPICVVILGCAVSVTGEMKFSCFGTLLLAFAVVCRCFKGVMQQKLMTGETKEKFDPVALMAWTCFVSLWVIMLYASATEGSAPLIHFASAPNPGALLFAIFVSCILACVLNLSALFVVKHIGAVGMQLVAQMKSVLIVIGGIALLHETFTPLQFVGFGAVLTGVYWYSSMKMKMDPSVKGH